MLKHCRPDILARGHLSLLHRSLWKVKISIKYTVHKVCLNVIYYCIYHNLDQVYKEQCMMITLMLYFEYIIIKPVETGALPTMYTSGHTKCVGYM